MRSHPPRLVGVPHGSVWSPSPALLRFARTSPVGSLRQTPLLPALLRPFPGKRLLWGPSPRVRALALVVLQESSPRLGAVLGGSLLHSLDLPFPSWEAPASTAPSTPTSLHPAERCQATSVTGCDAYLKGGPPSLASSFSLCKCTHAPSPPYTLMPYGKQGTTQTLPESC